MKTIAYTLPAHEKAFFLKQLIQAIPTEYWHISERQTGQICLQAVEGLSACIQFAPQHIMVYVLGQNVPEALLWENIFAELCERLQVMQGGVGEVNTISFGQ